MNIYIRVDSSISLGSGHMMRCLTLADALYQKGHIASFICRALPGNCINLAQAKQYKVFCLPEDTKDAWQERDACRTSDILKESDVDWLVVDNYSIEVKWEGHVRPYSRHLMVIDDLADRKHDCDLLLDQNYYIDLDNRYDGMVPHECRMLLGPRYALLREEFLHAKRKLSGRDGTVRQLLIFFGGTDPTNETAKALQAFLSLGTCNVRADVIIGAGNPNRDNLARLCRDYDNITFHCQVCNIAELMARADLAIGAGGTATWERCFLGLPAIIMIIADNQREVSHAVASKGAAFCVGTKEEINSYHLAAVLQKMMNDPDGLRRMSDRATQIMNCNDEGGAQKVVRVMSGEEQC